MPQSCRIGPPLPVTHNPNINYPPSASPSPFLFSHFTLPPSTSHPPYPSPNSRRPNDSKNVMGFPGGWERLELGV